MGRIAENIPCRSEGPQLGEKIVTPTVPLDSMEENGVKNLPGKGRRERGEKSLPNLPVIPLIELRGL